MKRRNQLVAILALSLLASAMRAQPKGQGKPQHYESTEQEIGFWKKSHDMPRRMKYPGCGDGGYVYLVERPDGRIVLLMGVKQFLDNDRTPTEYDKTIDGIIASLVFLK